MLDYLKTIYYELKAGFLIQKVRYKIEGKCKKCGKCCRFMYSSDTYTEKDFKLTTKLFPKYKIFEIIGEDEFGNLVFACKKRGKDGLCKDYKNRIGLCKKYPYNNFRYGAKLHEGCGFKIVADKKFTDFLSEYRKQDY